MLPGKQYSRSRLTRAISQLLRVAAVGRFACAAANVGHHLAPARCLQLNLMRRTHFVLLEKPNFVKHNSPPPHSSPTLIGHTATTATTLSTNRYPTQRLFKFRDSLCKFCKNADFPKSSFLLREKFNSLGKKQH
jgi:hypothetical protein